MSIAPIELPPMTDLGEAIVSVSEGGFTVSAAVTLALFSVAVMLALTVDDTGVVETMNVPELEVAAMVTVPSTVTPLEELSLEIVTVKPPAGAGLEIVSVPWDELPPITVVGLRTRLTSVGAVTVSGADALNKPAVAVTVVEVFVATATVLTVNELEEV